MSNGEAPMLGGMKDSCLTGSAVVLVKGFWLGP